MEHKAPIQQAESELIPRLSQELKKLHTTASISLILSPMAAWSLVLQIQLLARHPDNKNWMFDHAKNIAFQLEKDLELSDWLREFTVKGWNPELDIAFENSNQIAVESSNPTKMGVVIQKSEYILNNLALGVACQMLFERNDFASLQELIEFIRDVANTQLGELTPELIEKAVVGLKRGKL